MQEKVRQRTGAAEKEGGEERTPACAWCSLWGGCPAVSDTTEV